MARHPNITRREHLVSGAAKHRIVFLWIDWPGEPVLAHTAQGKIEIDGVTYLGVGGLGSISAVVSGDAGGEDRLELGLLGIPDDLMNDPFNEDAIGAEVRLMSGYFSPDRLLYGDLKSEFFGYIRGPKIRVARDETARTVDLTMIVTGEENPRLVLSAVHSAANAPAGDTLYRHLQRVEEEEPAWPA
ncbi:MAG: hypothetical protein AAF092_05095 [Pseudomonadota bacterium]